jgi:hypothetical protein
MGNAVIRQTVTAEDRVQSQARTCGTCDVHSVQQKSSGLIFRESRSDSDVKYSCNHNSRKFLLSPYLSVRGVSLSSTHHNHSRPVYINQRHQYIRLI